MSRYSNIEYLMEMDISQGTKMVYEAVKQKRRDEVYVLYASIYPNMDTDTFMTFPEYLSRVTGVKSDGSIVASKVSKEEVMSRVEDIMNNYTIKEIGGDE